MKEFRIIDYNVPNRYKRFEIQERSRYLGVWGWWTHVISCGTEEAAIEHCNKLEDYYSKKGPTEIHRVRVK